MKKLTLLLITTMYFTIIQAQSTRSYLGVSSNTIHPQKAEKLGFDQVYGDYITTVRPGTAAQKAGLKPFDYITAVGETTLTENTKLGHALRNYKAGELITVSIIRNGQPMIKNVALGSVDQRSHNSRADEDDPFLGVHQSHSATNGVDGVAVNISDNTTADYIGMEDGDIVTRIDDYPIIDWHDITAAIDARNPGDNINVTVIRNGVEQSLQGRIKSEAHDSPIDRSIDMEYMEVVYQSMEEEEMEMVEELLEEDISEMPVLMVNNLKLFPNPNIGQFNLEFEVGGEGDVFVMVYSSQGQLIINETLLSFSGRFSKYYDLGVEPAGTYFLMVRQGENVMTRKIIVTRS